MKSTKVQTLGTILLKCNNIWIENTFGEHNGTKLLSCIKPTSKVRERVHLASFQHILHRLLNDIIVLHVVKDQSVIKMHNYSIIIMQKAENEAKVIIIAAVHVTS